MTWNLDEWRGRKKEIFEMSKKIKVLILNFESGTRFQDFRKNNHHFGLLSLEINFLLANFMIECSRTGVSDPRAARGPRWLFKKQHSGAPGTFIYSSI